MITQDTICAISTPPGSGGIAIIRISGTDAHAIGNKLVLPKKKNRTLIDQPTNSVTYGTIFQEGKVLDEVLVSLFHAPHSFTGEDTIEIACHGSLYIQQEVMKMLVDAGCRLAHAGEFTQRAFLNGKMDLSQAEAVADLIASTTASMHQLAINQMRGGFSSELVELRGKLLHFTSLLELELDFSDHEELEFADRTELLALAQTIRQKIKQLIDSFRAGNAIKNGIPVAIIGKPNVGKSTLLNGLLNEERAIVSDIPGTTRDTIEETLNLEGQLFRFIDTAGLRSNTTDQIEAIGIRRSFEKAESASLILYLFDLTSAETEETVATSRWLKKFNKPILMVGTKNDLARRSPIHTSGNVSSIHISCKEPADIDRIKRKIVQLTNIQPITPGDIIVTNTRHYQALTQADDSITRVMDALEQNISGDLISQDLRDCLYHLGEITGEISNNEILGNIFSKFCIGK